MKSNKKLGTGLIVIGVIAIALYLVITGKVGSEMGKVHSITGPLSHGGEGGKMAGGMLESRASGEASGYMMVAQILLVGGAIAVLVGGYFVFFKKR
jgi:hypothetical protein